MLLSLDISITSTGYCIFEFGGTLRGFGTIKTDNSKTIYQRLEYIEEEIKSLLTKYQVTEIVIEAPSFGSRGANSYLLFGVHFSVSRLFILKNLPLTQLNIASIKKFATGSGRAKKNDMINALPIELKDLFLSHGFLKSKGLPDLADSYFIGKKYLFER